MKKFILTFFLILAFNFTNAYFLESLDAAKFLASKWIIVEKNNPLDYHLDSYVLRQEVAWVARWVASIPKKSFCENEFLDVSATKPNSWACYSVEALRDNDLIAKNSYFNPERDISKAEALWMIVKAAGFDYSYNPNSKKIWQEQLKDYAVFKWIVWDFSDYNEKATRWWIFEIAKNSIELIKTWKIDDDWNIEVDDDLKNILEELFSNS